VIASIEVDKNSRLHLEGAVEVGRFAGHAETGGAQRARSLIRDNRRPLPFAGRSEIAVTLGKAGATGGAPFVTRGD